MAAPEKPQSSEQTSEQEPLKPVPPTAVTDPALAEHIAYAVKPDADFNAYANKHGIGVLPMYTEQTLNRMAAAEQKARDSFVPAAAQLAMQELIAGPPATEDGADAEQKESTTPTLIETYPVFGTVYEEKKGARYPKNTRASSLMRDHATRRDERDISTAIGAASREAAELSAQQVITAAPGVNGKSTVFVYSTPGFKLEDRPKVVMGVVVPTEEAAQVEADVRANPLIMVKTFLDLQNANQSTNSGDTSDVRPPFENWQQMGFRNLGDAPGATQMLPLVPAQPQA